jgi:pimeloyl-ACP methyl ester carboxylesterase
MVHIEIHDWGGNGAPTLLAHAVGLHGRVWAPVAERLVRAGRRVWSFDFRGHGSSDRPDDGTYDWNGFTADVLEVTDRFGIGTHAELLAAGHSMGGAALLRAEIERPGIFPRIWTFEPIVIPVDEPVEGPVDNPLSAAARRRRDVWDSPDEALASYGSKPPFDAFTDEALRAYVDGGLRARPDGRYELTCRRDDEAAMYMTGPSSGIYPRLAEVHCPVRVVRGALDASPPARFGERIVERLEHAELVDVPSLGHFGPFEDPDAMVASMLEFATAMGAAS